MIDKWLRQLRRKGGKGSSLYLGLLISILLGLGSALLSYILIRSASYYYIANRYATAERQSERREEYLAELQAFVTENGISSEDTARIAEWAGEHRYTYLIIYKDNELFFTSDMKPEGGSPEKDSASPDKDGEGEDNSSASDTSEGLPPADGSEADGGGSENAAEGEDGEAGGGDSWSGSLRNREELIADAKANGLHPIELSDGTLFAGVTEYSQEFYYGLMNIISFAVAAVALTVVLVNYQRSVIARIKRLESDVTVVAHFDMNHRIIPEGHDEISRLSVNVETMRNAMLENIESERRAYEANTDLVTSISHDIRTPLTVLLGYLDMMKSCKNDESTMQSYIAASERTAMRLKELSDDMFKYSLAYGDTGSAVTLEEYDAATLIEQLLAENILLLEENGYEVVYEADENAIARGEVVYTSAPNLMRIVDNVFSNIRKYADREKPVTFGISRVRHSLVFTARNFVRRDKEEVESNGIGLKTCDRLAALIAEGFGHRELDGVFEITLSLRLGKAGTFGKT